MKYVKLDSNELDIVGLNQLSSLIFTSNKSIMDLYKNIPETYKNLNEFMHNINFKNILKYIDKYDYKFIISDNTNLSCIIGYMLAKVNKSNSNNISLTINDFYLNKYYQSTGHMSILFDIVINDIKENYDSHLLYVNLYNKDILRIKFLLKHNFKQIGISNSIDNKMVYYKEI